ncbi:MAG: hypothetical protein GQ581_10550, partial [Methyloprofundus sp.]|nr:hypothetical protein [Methyloprofundus sp.]
LEYGVAWAGKNNIVWGGGNNIGCPTANCPVLPIVAGTSSGEAYGISSLQYTRPSAISDYIRVVSTSTGNSDNSITATVETYIKPGRIITTSGRMPPPLVLDGCMTSTTGTPDIYPNWSDIDGDGSDDTNEWNDENANSVVDAGEWIDTNNNGVVDNEMGVSILTSQPENVGGNFCLDYCGPGGGGNGNGGGGNGNGNGGGGGCDATAAATGHTHADIHDGLLKNDTVFPHNSIWEYYFDVSQSEFESMASTTLSTNGGYYWITSSSNWPGGTYGSVNDPVIIVFTDDCPKPNGNTTIYGILFFLEVDGCNNHPTGSMNGWGNVTVYGSIGINGGLQKMNANLEIHGVGDGAGGMNTINLTPIYASKLPGTWKDF